MAMMMLALLLSAGLQGFALGGSSDIKELQSLPDTGDVCKDCTQIFELLVDLISNAELQKKILNGIESICAHMPGPTAKLCKEEVDKMFPVAITFVTGFVKPEDLCKMMGLCASSVEREKIWSYIVDVALQAVAKSENDKATSQCSLCILIVKTLEGMLPKERTEESVIHLLEELCHILPSAYRKQCEGIIGKFSKTVLDAIIGYATPQTICALIHQCAGQDSPALDPCTMSAYRCKDMNTAIKCGSLFYCQKFTWKPLTFKTI